MGYSQEARSLPFGHKAKPAQDIDGLAVSPSRPKFYLFAKHMTRQLLDEHLKSLRTENAEEDTEDDQAWDDWVVESDSDSSSEGSNWIDVESDGSDNLGISDSDNEIADGVPISVGPGQHSPPTRVSLLATTKVRSTPLHIQSFG